MSFDVSPFEDTMSMTYDEAREKRDLIKGLLEHDGWRFYLEFMHFRREGFKNNLLGLQVRTPEEVAEYNNLKGRYDENKMIPVVLEGFLTDLSNIVREYQDQEQSELELDYAD